MIFDKLLGFAGTFTSPSNRYVLSSVGGTGELANVPSIQTGTTSLFVSSKCSATAVILDKVPCARVNGSAITESAVNHRLFRNALPGLFVLASILVHH